MGTVFGRTGVEAPAFRHLGRHASLGFEVRVLPRSFAVETAMGRSVTGNGGDGSFGRLARFIGVFGTPENGKAAPIAMMAPVVSAAPSPAPPAAPVPLLAQAAHRRLWRRTGAGDAAAASA